VRISVWTVVRIRGPHLSLDEYGGCGLCRALTPDQHDGVLGRGQGPAQEGVGEETGGLWSGW
jgi:hypothetical protein